MATFGYRCPDHGPFDLSTPVGTAPPSAGCPRCGTTSSRVWTAPRLSSGSRAAMRVLDHCERTRSEPDVVGALPPKVVGPGGRRPAPSALGNPALQRLPRP